RSGSAAREAKAAQRSRVRRTLPVLSEPPATLSQINLVVQDMEQTLDFYRRLGLTIKDPVEWPPGSGARHTSVSMANGFGLEFDNIAGARTWNPGPDEAPAPGGGPLDGRHDLVGRAIAAGEHVKAFKAAQDKQEIHKVVDRLAFGWCREP